MVLSDKYGRERDVSWLVEFGEAPQEIGKDDERRLGFMTSSEVYKNNFYIDSNDTYKPTGDVK